MSLKEKAEVKKAKVTLYLTEEKEVYRAYSNSSQAVAKLEPLPLFNIPSDNPTIGILICKTQDNFIAEYPLRDIHKPMGVAEYETKIVSSLPKKLEGQLRTIDEIEAELTALPKRKQKKVRKRKPKK